MTHQVSIGTSGQGAFDGETGDYAPVPESVSYVGPANIYSQGKSAPVELGGVTWEEMPYVVEVPISFQDPVPVESIVTITGITADYSGSGSVGSMFIIDSAIEGTIEVSRRFYAHKYQERPNG